MLDEIFELFERDKKKRYPGHTGKRSLLDRVSGMLGDQEHRRSDDRFDRRYDDDDRPRYVADQYERRRDDDDFEDRRRYDDDRPRYEDDRYRDSDYRKPTKKKRFADMLDFD